MKNASDKIIWNSFRDGDKDSLEFIYESNYSALFYYGLKFSSDDSLIKDSIHELFIELINSGQKLSETNNIRYYLLKALRYKLIKDIKKLSSDLDEQKVSAEFNLVDSIETELIKNEVSESIRKKVVSSIHKLSEKQQELIYLRFYNDLPYDEIASLFEVKVQTVRNLMHRAVQSLKQDFEQNNIGKEIILLVLQVSL